MVYNGLQWVLIIPLPCRRRRSGPGRPDSDIWWLGYPMTRISDDSDIWPAQRRGAGRSGRAIGYIYFLVLLVLLLLVIIIITITIITIIVAHFCSILVSSIEHMMAARACQIGSLGIMVITPVRRASHRLQPTHSLALLISNKGGYSASFLLAYCYYDTSIYNISIYQNIIIHQYASILLAYWYYNVWQLVSGWEKAPIWVF